MQNDLQQAIHDNQFVIHYQPIVHTSSKKIGSVEALLRWDHPERRIVPPDEFIPLAEESGLIIPIGEWVLRTVCRNLSLWHKAGYFIQASVNISPIQFFSKDLIDTILYILQENELDPKWLNIEVTESTMVEQDGKVIEKIAKLRKLGMQVSLDDFGTGYASLRSLKEIKPDILKLDKSFIKDLPTEQDSVEIVSSLIKLAQKLSIIVVAEGVETTEQLTFLSELKCDWIQGYLFSRPVPEASLLNLLKGQWASDYQAKNTMERRKSFRIDFQFPLVAFMTVVELNGEKVQLGSSKVLIRDIGPDGLQFASTIMLPVNADVTLKFQMKILGEELVFYGIIVLSYEQDNHYKYGINFILDEEKRKYLTMHFNQFQLLLEKDQLLEGQFPFVTDGVDKYFKKK